MRAAPLLLLLACTARPPPPCSADLDSDSANCGECGIACSTSQRCERGLCVLACSGLRCPTPDGGLQCVDSSTDPSSCGACGHRCLARHSAPLCVDATCQHGPCDTGWFDCDRDPSNGCETNDASCRVTVCSFCQGGALSADGRRVLFTRARPRSIQELGGQLDLILFEPGTGAQRQLTKTLTGNNPPGDVGSFDISGDGTRVAFAHPSRLTPDDVDSRIDVYLVDLSTGLLSRTPPVDPTPYFDFTVSLSHRGDRLARSRSNTDRAFVVDLPSGTPSPSVTYTGAQLSPDGRTLGVLRVGVDVQAAPFHVDLESGVSAETLPRRYGSSSAPAPTGPPVFSFDGRVKAFHSGMLGYLPEDADAGSSTAERSFVVGADGGVLRVVDGVDPFLSYDGARLAFTELNARGCVVLDVATGATLFAENEVASVCSAFSGDGRAVLITGASDLTLVWLP